MDSTSFFLPDGRKSGLGSSAAAIITGLVGANALLGYPVGNDEILRLAAAIEGHPDEPKVGDALKELRSVCAFFKVLGTYPIDVH